MGILKFMALSEKPLSFVGGGVALAPTLSVSPDISVGSSFVIRELKARVVVIKVALSSPFVQKVVVPVIANSFIIALLNLKQVSRSSPEAVQQLSEAFNFLAFVLCRQTDRS